MEKKKNMLSCSPNPLRWIIHVVIISRAPESLRNDPDTKKGFITHYCHGPQMHLSVLMPSCWGSYLRNYQSVSLRKPFINCFINELLRAKSAQFLATVGMEPL